MDSSPCELCKGSGILRGKSLKHKSWEGPEGWPRPASHCTNEEVKAESLRDVDQDPTLVGQWPKEAWTPGLLTPCALLFHLRPRLFLGLLILFWSLEIFSCFLKGQKKTEKNKPKKESKVINPNMENKYKLFFSISRSRCFFIHYAQCKEN